MMTWLREKFGPIVVGAIIAMILFVFIGSDVLSSRGPGGRNSTVAGSVDGSPITLSEFNREYSRRVEFMKNMMGGKIDAKQIESMFLRERVFEDLVNRKLVLHEAERMGLQASDAEVKERIQEMPAFQKDKKFDSMTYKQVLGANGYTPGTFERAMREDLTQSGMYEYFRKKVKVADDEIRREFLVNQDQRNVRYVYITPDSAKKGANVKGEDVEAVRKEMDQVADQVVAKLGTDKGSEAAVNAMLKKYDLTVKSTGFIMNRSGYLPGVGEAKDTVTDAFAAKSPIDPKHGGKAKKYSLAGGSLVAVVMESKSPDLNALEKDRDQLIRQIASRKERTLFEEWLKKLNESARIKKNEALLKGQGQGEEG